MLLPESKLGVEWTLALKASSVDAFKPFLLHDKVLELSATTATSVVLLTELAHGLVFSLAVKLQEFILSVKLLFLTCCIVTSPSVSSAHPPLLFSLLLCFDPRSRNAPHSRTQHQSRRGQHQRRRTASLVLDAAPLPLLSPEQH